MACRSGVSNKLFALPIASFISTLQHRQMQSRLRGDTLNKCLRRHVPNGCVVHSFRHSMRDKLRAVQCPSDIIDQIGGWQTAGVGQSYKGYELDVLHGG